MAQGNSFTNQGATPFYKQTPQNSGLFTGGTPQANALNTFQSAPSLPQAPTSSAPVKKQVITHPSGATVETHYDNSSDTTGSNPDLMSSNKNYNFGSSNTDFTSTPTGQGVGAPTAYQDPTYAGYLRQLTDTAKGNIALGQRAQDIASQAGQQISNIGQTGARAQTGYLTTGTSPVAEGNAAVIAQNVAKQQQAVAEGAQAALQGTAQGLTGQQQTQQGIGTAIGAIKPELGAFGQTFYSPLQAGQGGGGITAGSQIDSALNQYAQMAANGQISAVPSSITSNPVLNAELNRRAQVINPSYSPITSAAKGASATDLTSQVSSIQAQANGADQNFKLMFDIAKSGGVNDANVPVLNTLQQNLQRGLTSNVAVANFQSLIQSVRSQYAAILGGGSVTVESLNEAKSLIPDDISLSALQSLGDTLKTDAQNRIDGINKQISQLQGGSTVQGGNAGSQGGFSEGQTSSDGSLVFKNGQWQKNF